MNARLRFWLGVVILGLLMTGPFVLTGVLLYADAGDAERVALQQLLLPRLPLGTLITLLALVLGVALLRGLFKQYVTGLMRMAEQMRLMLGANRDFRVTPQGPPEVCELARAVNALAQQRDILLTDVDSRIADAKASVEAEKNRLAALMSELAMAVVVCNLDGRILLYNSRARLQFKALAQGPTSMSGGALIGLGRSIFSILERAQIAYALETIQVRLSQGSTEPQAHFIMVTRGGQLLRVQVAPVLGSDGAEGGVTVVTGYVLTIDNITRNFERESQRDQALQQMTDGSRAALANIRAAVETLIDSPDMEQDFRERFMHVISDEASAMSSRLDTTMHDFADSLKTRWPLEDVLGVDLIAAAARRIDTQLGLPTKTEELDAALWVRADSFALIQSITYLASQLQYHYSIRELRFKLTSNNNMVFLDLIWSGAVVSSETMYSWELDAMTIGEQTSSMTLRDVLSRHGGEIWFQRDKAAHRAFFRMVLPIAAAPEAFVESRSLAGTSAGRPEYYDFDLFAKRDMESSGIDLDRTLSELTFSVFDTETTGLEPTQGDEIIQIGAVRLVNSRLLRQEVFDQLVDPRIRLKPEGIPIHGITESMLNGQPTLDAVLPAFHEFCTETVLIAHNAAFDMRFLQLKEVSLGIRFTQPVLDTLLLSAVIHPNQESHRLESIAERLGINVTGRHTALGDAFVTGEIFLKMVPLLAAAGIVTLRQALDASAKTYYARVKY
jgi:DNA polymerase-3 subunit epsilon